ncbi:hypothetical protein EON63_10835 [archaeon]|nr:MAG: hypothetical protein EON63_10835 [archaeon]
MKSKFPVNKAVKANGKYDKYSSKPVDSAKGAKNAHLKWENAEDDDDDDNSQNSANDSEEDVSDNDNEENIDEYFESEPEEHGNAYESDGYEDMEEGSTGDGEGDYSDEDEDEPLPPRPHPGQVSTKAPTTKKPISEVLMPSNVPLYKLLAKQHKLSALSDAHALSDQHTHKRPKKAKRARTDAELDEEGGKKKRNKRAPTEMRSDKPVRRYVYVYVCVWYRLC